MTHEVKFEYSEHPERYMSVVRKDREGELENLDTEYRPGAVRISGSYEEYTEDLEDGDIPFTVEHLGENCL